MDRFLSIGRGIFLNYEHGFLHGPHKFKSSVLQPEFAIALAEQAKLDGLFFNVGIVEHYEPVKPIIKLTSGVESNDLSHPIAKICSVERAIKNNARAVMISFQDISSSISSLEVCSELINEAKNYGLPVIINAVPKEKSSEQTLMHTARLALELGADAVVLKYNFDPSSFKHVVSSAAKCKVIVDMDHVINTESEDIIVMRCKELLEQGVQGFSFGTSLLNHHNPVQLARRLRANI